MNTFQELLDAGTVNQNTEGFFCCARVSIETIINRKIVILGYVPNVKTKQGDGRTMVHFTDPETGKDAKFLTNCGQLKRVLLQIPPDKFPFETTIISYMDGKIKLYKFT